MAYILAVQGEARRVIILLRIVTLWRIKKFSYR